MSTEPLEPTGPVMKISPLLARAIAAEMAPDAKPDDPAAFFAAAEKAFAKEGDRIFDPMDASDLLARALLIAEQGDQAAERAKQNPQA